MSHVKGYYHRAKNGNLVFVKEHNDKRAKHSRTKTKHVIKLNPGMEKMKSYITGLLKTPQGQKELTDKIKKGEFKQSLPEVIDLYGVEQGPHHPILDAFDHTMEVVKRLPDNATDNQRWAALLHDIGKTDKQRFDKKRGIVFDGHEYEGAKIAKKVLNRFGFNSDDKEEILFLIKHHGDLRTKLLHGDKKEAKKFTDHKHFDSLLTVHNADVTASGRDPKEVNDAVEKFKNLKKAPVEKDQLDLPNFIKEFKEFDEFYKYNKTPEDFKGSCDGVSTDLYNFLKEKGVKSKLIQGIGFKGKLGKDAAKGWVDFIDGQAENLKYLTHVVVTIKDKVIDLTGLQFGKKNDKQIVSLSDFKKVWQTTKPFKPLR